MARAVNVPSYNPQGEYPQEFEENITIQLKRSAR
jgi:hypothetical protein